MLCVHGQYIPTMHPLGHARDLLLLVVFHAKTPISSLISYCSN